MTNENYRMMCFFVRNGFRSVLEIHISHSFVILENPLWQLFHIHDCHLLWYHIFQLFKNEKLD